MTKIAEFNARLTPTDELITSKNHNREHDEPSVVKKDVKDNDEDARSIDSFHTG